MRGDTSSAFGPNTGTICRFSVRYWMNTTPRLNGLAKGGSTTIFAAGWGFSSLSDGVGHPQKGYRYDQADECPGHICFS